VKSPLRTRGVLVTAATGLALTLSACGSDDPPEGSATSPTATTSAPAAETTAVPVASDQPFGAGCSVVPAEGEGSFAGMADDPVTTAATNNPALSQLVTAVTTANLGDSLNSLQNITVLAPANTAFDAVGPEAYNGMLADIPQLTAVLTHHVIQGRLTPAQLAGTHTTLNNDEVTIEGSGESFTVAGEGTLTQTDASVICGNVQTATATVYIVDQVLAPPAA
jgi:uncharacterized surface protein with fasciclin (FAS1) repeats